MNQILLYCRQGFEKECAGEIQDKATQVEVYGFPRVVKNSGYVVFECYQQGDAEKLIQKLPFSSLIFARQMIVVVGQLSDLDPGDRISPILAMGGELPKCGDVRVETPDTNQAKELLKFCRKFTVPLRQSLRKRGVLYAKEHSKKPVLHVCFTEPGCCFVGYSVSNNNSPHYMGIHRLKFPSEAPSRSTLKLEEAFHAFIPKDEWDERLAPGMKAVDLGACPGGWTYQLVKRSMFIHAVDNGQMAESLMETGQVKYHAADGFKFEPPRKNITWLVCDMIEKPYRVAPLIGKWLVARWAVETIFNLKLPMSRRYEQVTEDIGNLKKQLIENGVKFDIQVKHLFHDRDEVTVHIRRTN
ncbi:23S rRNA (cytidine(2498)-2'-O)-methyltransferase RlmM [Enterovibrio norvegicus]|uniref:Ribosomal RNA large subunit methyltransferase M n=1 Tax=Enterovibrio norvegicus DSM 15893 TaxID=1121869 RepID=A0A1I5W118_9GAMM|nr:23S rRNA (cytidine(2498)-2'-O)-methyltransferase RlmM [Enterovibrio norvegicus]MCC4799333.1 23S rRNA (cytidine(2498)-2'-O)-methyltransferase RlmM [Enterovibrio norvegicus]OEE62538.1 23S rRNA (cytidine(2498)-2'-O)-methyltransferase RlmM [Enterovibrio norvegicus]PMI28969.1 23S rRNA (cytidine(2498)-2'-O)-methyltransferase RlmM [Enterovibrio norvegicus]PMI37789.1 23S rRNA (cytidine(2498)-2'-O)-methyltransferase RlmM [Enterovibrio norvegicus]PMN49663.1 23S rRNA (cytidine(2498)-2'-O)-methyltransf